MHPSFIELNLYVYYRLLGRFYDGVIWCLGPLVDEAGDYGLLRCYLALITRRVCRAVM